MIEVKKKIVLNKEKSNSHLIKMVKNAQIPNI